MGFSSFSLALTDPLFEVRSRLQALSTRCWKWRSPRVSGTLCTRVRHSLGTPVNLPQCLHHVITTQGNSEAPQPRSAEGSEPLGMGPPWLEKADPSHKQPSGYYPHRPVWGD